MEAGTAAKETRINWPRGAPGVRSRLGAPPSSRWTTPPHPTLFSLAHLRGWVILFSAQEMSLQ